MRRQSTKNWRQKLQKTAKIGRKIERENSQRSCEKASVLLRFVRAAKDGLIYCLVTDISARLRRGTNEECEGKCWWGVEAREARGGASHWRAACRRRITQAFPVYVFQLSCHSLSANLFNSCGVVLNQIEWSKYMYVLLRLPINLFSAQNFVYLYVTTYTVYVPYIWLYFVVRL